MVKVQLPRAGTSSHFAFSFLAVLRPPRLTFESCSVGARPDARQSSALAVLPLRVPSARQPELPTSQRPTDSRRLTLALAACDRSPEVTGSLP